MVYIFRILLLSSSAALLYLMIPYRLAEIQAEFSSETLNLYKANTRALYWNPNSSKALTNLAERSKNHGEFSKAKDLALAALNVDPTNGQAMSILVSAYDQLNDTRNSEKALALAPKLWSAHSYVHITLANYWARKGRIKNALVEWDLLITRHRALYKQVFPNLQTFANAENSRDLLIPYVSEPASWWDDFFNYMATNQVSLPVLKYFYELRIQNDSPLNTNELQAYVKRLQQDGYWKRAYAVWVTGLNKKQIDLLGLLFDGGFESKTHNTAYDWHFKQSRQAKITLGRTQGIVGKRALHISFKKHKSIMFKHVWQQLLLEPRRTYIVKMNTRIDSLKNPAGLVWKVRCAGATKQVLVESEALLGTKQWHEVSFEFTVLKTGCEIQTIHLEAVSKFHHEQFFEGGIWFDQLDISLHGIEIP